MMPYNTVKSRVVVEYHLSVTCAAIVHSMNSDGCGLTVSFSKAPATLFGLDWSWSCSRLLRKRGRW